MATTTGAHAVAHTFTRMAELCGGTAVHDDGLLLYRTTSPDPIVWNGALLTASTERPSDVLRRADAFFEPLDQDYGVWIVSSHDEALASYLASRGLERVSSDPHMAVWAPLAPLPLTRGEPISVVSSASLHHDFLEAATRSFLSLGVEADTWSRVYPTLDSVSQADVLAVVAGEPGCPLAVAMGYLHEGVCEVIHVGTIPEARRRGLGASVTAAVLEESAARGATLAVLQATPMGEPVYQQLGFTTIDRYDLFLRRGRNDAPPASSTA